MSEQPTTKRRTWLRVLLGSSLAGIILGLATAGAGWWWLDRNILSTLPSDLSNLRDWRPPTACRVYDASERLLDEFYLERRIWVSLAELPDFVSKAFIAAEDRRFYKHKGVDLTGIARALYVNLTTKNSRQGGSTITQQLVKNILVGSDRTYARKIREAVLAYRLEQSLTKDEILELYINYVYLGAGNYGVEAAARDFFGLSARAIDPGQAALLAGLVPAPSRYSPRTSREQAKKRRELVLASMVEAEFLDPEEAESYLDDPVVVPRESRGAEGVGLAYATMVRREIRSIYGNDIPVEAGLRFYVPLDLELQGVAEQAIRDALVALEGRQGRMGPVRRLPPGGWETFRQRAAGLDRDPARGTPLPPSPGDCFEAAVGPSRDLGLLEAGTFTFSLQESDRAARVRGTAGTQSATVARPLNARVEPGDVLRVCAREGDGVVLDPRPWSEGATMVMENDTGRILALVGGYDVTLEGFVRATQARRQPGSSFKPYVYAAALLAGRSQADVIVDAPIDLPAGGGKRWRPKNYDGRFHGPVRLRTAFAKSLNTVAVRLLLETGADAVIDVARNLGVRELLRNDPTLALGSSEVTLFDQVRGYSTIARLGLPITPVFIDRAVRDDEVTVGRAGARLLPDWPVLPGGTLPRALPAGVAYELADMMEEVVRAGTARSAARPGRDRRGKTGTTNGFVDAWFVGFTPRYTVGVWIGTDGTQSLGDKETGGRAALPAWKKIVEALPEVDGQRLPIPDDALRVEVEGEWLGLARGGVPRGLLGLPIATDGPLPPVEAPAAPSVRRE